VSTVDSSIYKLSINTGSPESDLQFHRKFTELNRKKKLLNTNTSPGVAPMDLVVLVDGSGSIKKDEFEQEKKAVTSFIESFDLGEGRG
jgi:hypothetical protein